MKKRELSPIELKKVIELRQLGAKWTEIEREIRVDRRASKRAYEEWERDKIMKEQEMVRFRVAAEAFHEHLNDLIRIAEYLVRTIQVPELLRGMDSANEAFERLWTRDVQGEYDLVPNSSDNNERIVRRNKMLFESLKTHTQEKVRWESLDEWKQARNIAFNHSIELRSQAAESVSNILNNNLDLKEKIINAIGGNDVSERIADGVRETIWRGILTGEPDQVHTIMGANKWRMWLEFYQGDTETKLDLNDQELANEVLSICRETVKYLRGETKFHFVQVLAHQVQQMRDKNGELERNLEPLVLRPIILWTRCDLCPV